MTRAMSRQAVAVRICDSEPRIAWITLTFLGFLAFAFEGRVGHFVFQGFGGGGFSAEKYQHLFWDFLASYQ